MSLFNVFNIAGSAMSAQTLRLNTISSNLANSDSVGTTPEDVYKSRQPVFASVYDRINSDISVGVRVVGIAESQVEPSRSFQPGNPLANDEGYVYQSNVNTVEEMANMLSASRSFQNNVEAMNTAKQLILATLRLGE